MAVRSLGSFAGALLVMSVAGSAQAYCRTHTQDPAASMCPEACHSNGDPLAWHTSHLTYGFNVKGFPGIAEADLRRQIAESIGTWEQVRCAGKSVGIQSTADSQTTTLTVGPESDEPNENVIVHFDITEWNQQELPSQAFAITAVWFDSNTGQILGADMMFNGRMDPFGECHDTGCTATDPHTDLRNVATHEFGHFLGLSHSDVDGSTMWCDAEPGETSKRSLTPDDVAGLCAIYPPGQAFAADRQGVKGGCALGDAAQDAAQAPWAGLALPLLMLWRRRRARRKQA